jgi:hypothetical protein
MGSGVFLNRRKRLPPNPQRATVPIRLLNQTANLDETDCAMGVKKTGKGRRKIGRKKRKMRSRIRHRK